MNAALLDTVARRDLIGDIMVEHGISRAAAKLFLARASKRQSGFATGNTSFPIQYTTRQMRKYVAKRLNMSRTLHIDMQIHGWGRQYFKGLVVGMSDMVDAFVNNDVEA